MEKIVIDNGRKKIGVYDTDDELITVISINVNDPEIPDKFANLIEGFERISADMGKDFSSIKEKDTDDIGDKIKNVRTVTKIRVEYINQMIEELENMFGDGIIRETFKDNYEHDENFVPDEFALYDFVEQVTPIMSELFGRRYELNRKKYNSSRKGKHTKTKNELLSELKERESFNNE